MPSIPSTQLPEARTKTIWKVLNALGFVLIAAMACWIVESTTSPDFALLGWRAVWFPAMPTKYLMPWPHFGLDFMFNFAAVHTRAGGGNPYQLINLSFAEPRYVFPPILLHLFSWTSLIEWDMAREAVDLWMIILCALGTVAGIGAVNNRYSLGVTSVPASLVVALFLCSTPFLFELERGNCNMLILGCIMAGVAMLNKRSTMADLVASLLFAIAIWIKLYPGLLIIGLLALRRWRVTTLTIIGCFLIGLLDWALLAEYIPVLRQYAEKGGWSFANHAHSMTRNWDAIWSTLHLPIARQIPAIGWTLLAIIPPLAFVSFRVFCSTRRDDLALLLLLWITSVATFVPSVSFDYNLIFLVIALLIAWDASHPLWLQALFAVQLYWLQPFAIPFTPTWLTYWLKLSGVVVVALVLVRLAGSNRPANPNMTQ